jgi:AcrR family transcriptional regulator
VSTSEEQVPTRRERRRAETRQRLIGAARELITEKGVAGLRISELAERADVGLGSFYNHFETKEALVEQVVTESLQTLSEAILRGAADGDPAELVNLACHRIIRLAYDDPEFARLLVHLNHGDSLFATAIRPYAKRAVDAGIESGRFPVLDEEVALTLIIGAAFAVMRAIVESVHPADAEIAFADSVLRLLGVPADEARAISTTRPSAN